MYAVDRSWEEGGIKGRWTDWLLSGFVTEDKDFFYRYPGQVLILEDGTDGTEIERSGK